MSHRKSKSNKSNNNSVSTLNQSQDEHGRNKTMFVLGHILELANRARDDAQGVASLSDADTAQIMMIAGKVLVCWAAGQMNEEGFTYELLQKVDRDTAKVAHLYALGKL